MKRTYQYRVLGEFGTGENNQKGISFGIIVIKTEQSIEKVIHDVSMDEDAVQRLVRRCNKEKLDPIHLMDLIEDELLSK